MANKKISELNTNSSPSTSATLVGVDNGETVQIPISALGGSGGGIIKVIENDVKVEMYSLTNSGLELKDDIFEIVDVLPETGTPCLDFVNGNKPEYWYYQKSDGALYGYADDEVASVGGVPVGWYPIEMVYDFIGSYNGMISSTSEITEEGDYALVTNSTKTNLYYDDNGVFVKIITEKDFEFDASTGTLVLNL